MKKTLLATLALVAIVFNFGFFQKSNRIANARAYMSGMAVMEVSSKRLLNNYNETKKLPMASTTKVVTAITVINNANDLNEIVKIPMQAVGVEGSSIYLVHNEELRIIDLLYGLMLQSGNDCAVALAIHMSGSIEKFANLMNEQAKKFGAKNSNFVNPHGLHHKDHYTTAYDLALISSHAMQNKVFAKIVGTKLYKMPWADRNYQREIKNKNKILTIYDGGTGIKTGFTRAAGRCLVSSGKRNNMEVVAVVLNCGPMFEECSSLMDEAFETYHLEQIIKSQSFAGNALVRHSNVESIKTYVQNEFFYPVSKEEKNRIRRHIIFDDLEAPIKKNQAVGKINIYLDNKLLFSDKVYSIQNAKSTKITDKFKDMIENWRNN